MADTWDDLAEDYATFARIMRRVHPQVGTWIHDQLREWALRTPAGDMAEAFDVGCGSGVYTRLLATHCRSVSGYDPSPRMVQLAWQQSSSPDNRIGYVAGQPRPDATANVVLSTFAAHHMDSDVFSAYAYLRDLVRPGGTVLIVDVVCDEPDLWRSRQWHIERAERYRAMTHAALEDAALAATVLRIMTSGAWLSHVMADRPPTRTQMLYAARSAMPRCWVGPISEGVEAVSWSKPKE